MSMLQKISEDLKNAMKGGRSLEVETLRMLLASLKNREIEKRGKGGGELTDDEVLEVIGREVKKRREAAEIFAKSSRTDLADKENKEIEILGRYLPPQMSKEEIESVIDAIIQKGTKEFGAVMKEAMKELRGKADGKVVGEIIKSKLI